MRGFFFLVVLAVGCASGSETAPSPAPAEETPTVTVTSPAPALSLAAPSPVAASASPIALVVSASASAAVDAPPPPCPSDMVLVGRFCVDPYEGFLQRRSEDGTLTDHPYYDRPEAGVTYVAANKKGSFPQGYISQIESANACKEAGKRLCTRGEWIRSCRGKGFSMYPYGHKGIRTKCNTGKNHLLTLLFKKPQGGMKYAEHFNSPELNKTPDFLAPSGKYEECTSDLGVSDAVGNLHEWVSGKVTEDLMADLEKEEVERRDQPWQVGNGIFMGGFYSTTSEHGPGCSFITVAHEPAYHDYSTGFRCCKDAVLPKPEKKAAPPKKPAPGKVAVNPSPTK